MDAALDTANVADCSSIVTPCDELNRRDCDMVPNTCGPCKDGYAGVSGYANTPCFVSSTSSSRRMLASSRVDSQARHIRALVGGAVGDFCSANNDCVLGQCDNGVCVDAPKACPQNCFGRGFY